MIFYNNNAQDFTEVFVVDTDKVHSYYWHIMALEISDMYLKGMQVLD